MEIHTQHLLTFSLQEDRLQNNFLTISAALTQMQAQLNALSKHQEVLLSAGETKQKQIDDLYSIMGKQVSAIHRHDESIQQINSQFSSFGFAAEEGSRQSTPLSQRSESPQIVGDIGLFLQPSSAEKQPRREIELPKVQKEVKKPVDNRNTLDKVLSNIKERLLALEKDSEEKERNMEELSRFFKPKKNRESTESQIRKISRDSTLKPIHSKKQIIPNPSRHLLDCRDNNQEEKVESERTINRLNTEELENAGITSEKDMESPWEELIQCEVDKIRATFQQKIRILQLQLKENHSKVQNIEKNMDMLQRSHDLLKYDYEKTSSSFRGKPHNETHQMKSRRDQRLNDTRVTNREYYEEKLLELFNEMDFLRNQYLEIQARFDREDPDQSEEARQLRKSKIGARLIHQAREQQDDTARKEVASCRRELKKLREQLDSFAAGVNAGTHEVKTYVIKPNENKQDWKSLSTKMYKLKMELQAGVRELQGKIVTNNDMVVVLNQLEVGIEECRLLIRKKVESADFQKSIKRLETRLNNFILQVYEKDGTDNDLDATMVKQPWFCLSCDSQLKNYTGKQPKPTPPAEKLVGRKVNPESHMIRRADYSRLPSVLK